MLAISFFQNSICKSMTFRINYLHEDFSGLTRLDVSTLRVENRYLMLIQTYTYRQRVKNASHFCIKLENLRFTFMRTLATISNGSEYPFEHYLTFLNR